MKHWCLWYKCTCETAVSSAEQFYFAMLTFPTEICFANSYTPKSIDAAWQTTDILNTAAMPCQCQQLAILCPSWKHSSMAEAGDLSSAFRMTQRLSPHEQHLRGKAALSSSQTSLQTTELRAKTRPGGLCCFQGETNIPQKQTNKGGSLAGKQKTGLRYKEKMKITLGSGPLYQEQWNWFTNLFFRVNYCYF